MDFNYFMKTRERLAPTGFQALFHVWLVEFHMSHREKMENVIDVMNFYIVFPTETNVFFSQLMSCVNSSWLTESIKPILCW